MYSRFATCFTFHFVTSGRWGPQSEVPERILFSKFRAHFISLLSDKLLLLSSLARLVVFVFLSSTFNSILGDLKIFV